MTTKQVTNPFDQSLITEMELDDAAAVEEAISTAQALFLDRDRWLPAYQRVEILEKVVEIMSGQVEELTMLCASEGGKPYMDSKVEVMRAINGVKLAIEHMPAIKGEQIPMGHTESSANRLAFTQCEPIGVVASLSAFNHPLNLIVHQTIPALAVGCPVIVKPASSTPMSCFRFIEILHEAGLPKGWARALLLGNQDATALATDPRINFMSFIGSGRIGWMLASKLAPGTRYALEHGGAAPVIVDQSADVEPMLDLLTKGGFYHAGQVCVSVQRVYVPQDMSEQVAKGLAERASKMKVGDQLDPETEVGPLIDPGEVNRVEEWVNAAQSAGGKIMCGGKRISDTCYEPTVILDPPDDAEVSKSEIFGPVVCVYSYKDKQEAVDRANGLEVAFQASVFTKDLDDALDTGNRLNATAVMINDHTAFRVDWMPFGGRDASGMGMGGIPYSMHEMTRDKMFVIKSSVL
ncbi:MAG: acyl-CoA reductase-like NAD-dependent aldehyde dehydrogenase [Arenicella sp.]|jgi:acyl-CoA reductase-like NAD-dependent aldehyde dehydrogenase